MKIATWNVNSLKVRLYQLLDWLDANRPDVLCLQELKMEDKAFPEAEIRAAGYYAAYSGQKTYNGVAILASSPPENVTCGIPGFNDVSIHARNRATTTLGRGYVSPKRDSPPEGGGFKPELVFDEQKRLIAATVGGLRIVCGYFPNGQTPGSEKFAYKMAWLDALTRWLSTEALPAHPNLVLAGDFNIAPEAADTHPEWKGEILVSPPERAAFRALVECGLIDSFRLFEQPEQSYTWWDYRMGSFRRNFGMRIDHILVSSALRNLCRACTVDKTPRKLERPSDHTPVVLELDWPHNH
ncbi:MAG: exodeoxyribonuclease III [Azoarcus sp.]|jgi:exodeoxyribonuclease-3|nr:exodeoxyribonuclease III [Azoarcus sp.]